MMKVLLPKIIRNKLKKLFTTQNVESAAVRPPVTELPQVDNVVQSTNVKINEKTNDISELNSKDRKSSRKYVSAEIKKKAGCTHPNRKNIRPLKSDICRSFEKTDEWKLLNSSDKKLIKSILENQFWRSGCATALRRQEQTSDKEIRCTAVQSVSAIRRSSNYTSRRNSFAKISTRRPPFRTVPKFNQISEFTLPYQDRIYQNSCF